MCGIVGYIGHREAPWILLDGLKRLEYRGYDSAGMALVHGGSLQMRKAVGKLANLEAALHAQPPSGTLGVGHTRWATHGRPSVTNSHPHLSCDNRIAVVHNGILENHAELRERLRAEGHQFTSETDTEVMGHLVEDYYTGDLVTAVRDAVLDLEGAFAFGVVCADHPDELVAVRRFSPLVVGIGEGENYIASDMGAIRQETDRVHVIGDCEIAQITRRHIMLYDFGLNAVRREVFTIPWPAEAAQKGGHKHFMHKEIHEQPDAMRARLSGRLSAPDRPIVLDGLNLTDEDIRGLRQIYFTACGTAYHAGMVGRFLMEKLARVPAQADLAAELRTRDPVVPEGLLCVVVSQSGETADSLVALRDMRERGARIASALNVVDSSIARESDGVIYLQAGPEIGVASTKAYTLQLLTLEMMAIHFAEARRSAPAEVLYDLKRALLELPDRAEELLAEEDHVRDVAARYRGLENALYLGRGINVPSAMEGALKLKEISYLHAEAYSAGEMKHGPIALVSPELLTVAIATRGEMTEKMLGNMQEVRAREGPVIGVLTEGDGRAAGLCDEVLSVPECPELVSPVAVAIPLQLFAYHMADLRGESIDQPRNLAKTVTVE